MATSPIEKNYGVPESEAMFWRGKIESRIIRMVHLTDVTERASVRELWTTARVFEEGHIIEPEQITRALDLVCTNDGTVPLLVKTYAIARLCKVAPEVDGQTQAQLWKTLRDCIATEPDDVNYFILMGSWVAGLGLTNMNEFYQATHILDGQTTPDAALNRFGVQTAMARMSDLIHHDRLHLGLLTVLIKGRDDISEYRSSHGFSGYPDTIMILPQGHKPSDTKMEEAAAVGVPEISKILTRRSLMTMVGVEVEQKGTMPNSLVRGYTARKWSFISLGALRSLGELPQGHSFVPDGLTLWFAIEASDDLRDRIKQGEKIPREDLRAIIRKHQEKFTEPIWVTDITTREPRQVEGVLSVAHRELVNRIGKRDYTSLPEILMQVRGSVYELVMESSNQGAYVPDRDQILSTFLEAAWQIIPDEDKWAFAKIIFHPDSSLWNIKLIKSYDHFLVNKLVKDQNVTVPEPIKKEVFRLVKDRLRLKQETIRDKQKPGDIEGLISMGGIFG